jgi:hypothetical protein
MSKVSKVSKVIKVTRIEEPVSCESEFNLSRINHMSSDNVSSEFISVAMTYHFPSSELLDLYSSTHRIYKMSVSDFISNVSVKNWIFNRPPDEIRCQDIAKSIYDSRRPIDTPFCIGYNHKTNIFQIYDGIHRLTALKIIKEENSRELDFSEIGSFGSKNDGTVNWLYNSHVIVNIRFGSSASDSELIWAFQNLNKSQAVPDLYIRDPKGEKREVIENLANEWCHIYKIHFTSSSNPNTGHTNRNKFIELLDKIYEKYNLDGTDANRLKQILNDANNKIRNNYPRKITVTMLSKCMTSGCYLFLYKNDILEEMI